jgi:hypothetical protein
MAAMFPNNLVTISEEKNGVVEKMLYFVTFW